MSKKLQISIIIIGYNTSSDLLRLLGSIKVTRGSENILEIIYIDDGSSDSSFEQFKSFPLAIHKRGKKLDKNRGRAYATNAGISMARGDWCLFVRSNEIFSSNLLLEYKKIVAKKKMLAYMGSVKYSSVDKKFVNYLNNSRRGVGLFKDGTLIHYKFLLFNNSMIQTDACRQAGINTDLRYYGGEELDFAYRFNLLYPRAMCACPGAIVYRKNYPSLKNHCLRLEEFGNKNLKQLANNLQYLVVGYYFLLRVPRVFRFVFSLAYVVFAFINTKLPCSIYLFIRIQFLLAILKGYYKTS